MKVIELPAIKETAEDYEGIEERILEVFRRELYFPLLDTIGFRKNVLANAKDNGLSILLRAIESGKVHFFHGTFSGTFGAAISRELKRLGATWDKKTSTFKIQKALLPAKIRTAISASEGTFRGKLDRLDMILQKMLPAKVAGKVKTSDLFNKELFKVDKKVERTLKNITVMPKLTDKRRQKIADEWQNNMRLWIKDFTEQEIKKLRKKIMTHAMGAGRYEDVIKDIQRSYGVTYNKAKFLARQETSLLMTKFKETRYTEAGIYEYRWGCVAGSPNHPVRPSHKILEGKIFRWDNPPVTTAPDEPARKNNPGQDYNCRCFARPIVRAL